MSESHKVSKTQSKGWSLATCGERNRNKQRLMNNS